jgi:RHS repeat-associated protein
MLQLPTVQDAAGNLIGSGTLSYTYNQANRLSERLSQSTVTTTYQYNGLGQRTAAISTSPAKLKHYHYGLGGKYLGTEQYDGSGNLVQRYEYIWVDDMPVAQFATSTSTRLTYIHSDHLNTPRIMTDAAGVVAWRWDQDAYGLGSPDSNPDGDAVSDILDLRFPGQIKNDDSGFYYNVFRDYDPNAGRYVQSDPIGLNGGLNAYVYVEGNPISHVDPEGLRGGPGIPGFGPGPRKLEERAQGKDPCGCFFKSYFGYAEAGVAAAEGLTGPYVSKPRGGAAGGGPSGSQTSVVSSAAHQLNKRYGKNTATRVLRNLGRQISKSNPYVTGVLLIYDTDEYQKCLKECKENDCGQQ